MRILMVDPVPVYLSRRITDSKLQPLLGLAYVATYVREKGHHVRVLDRMVEAPSDDEYIRVLTEFRPQIIAMTVTVPFIESADHLLRLAKEYLGSVITVLGGGAPSMASNESLRRSPSCDYVVVGEGEMALSDLLQALESGSQGGTIPGVMARGCESLFVRRTVADDIDSIPPPDWSLFPMDRYGLAYSIRFQRNVRSAPILFSRGCPYQCTFCASSYGSIYRQRKAIDVAAEMTYNNNAHGIQLFDFLDATALLGAGEFDRFCRLLIDKGCGSRMSFTLETRADSISHESMALAATAGCESILLGIESGDQSVGDSLAKGMSIKQYVRAFEIAHSFGVHIRCTLILGSLYETKETLANTWTFCVNAFNKFNVEFLPGFLSIYPGTRVFNEVESGVNNACWKPGVRDDWSKARREHPMITVNGLPEDELMEYMERIRELRLQSIKQLHAEPISTPFPRPRKVRQ